MNITKSTFAHFKEYILSNPSTGESVHILPELGGIIRKLSLRKGNKSYTIINCGNTLTELLAQLPSYPSTHLFPWGNRVRNGQFTYEGTTHQLALNEVNLQNALHGFVYLSPFKIMEATVVDDVAILVLRYTYKGGYFGYPFPFTLDVTHSFSTGNGLTISYIITNIGTTTMPTSLGWHPYFQFEGEKVDDLLLTIPSTHQYQSDSQMIPVGRAERQFGEAISLSNVSLDTIFALEPSADKHEIILHSPAKDVSIHLWQDAAANQFNYSIVYTPDSRDRIAIEPMTAPTDALNSGENLLEIKAGEEYVLNCGVYLG